MKHLLPFRIITENEKTNNADKSNPSYEICDKNLAKSSPSDRWDSLNAISRKKLLSKIKSDVENSKTKAIDEYDNWFSKADTRKKFKPSEIKVLDGLIPYLRKVQMKYWDKTPEGVGTGKGTSYAWVNGYVEPYVLNVCLKNVHNGFEYTTSIEGAVKHELGHLIDAYFDKNKVTTYLQTVKLEKPGDYKANYAINDKDQYSRLNVLRGIIGAEPFDSAETMLDKFLNKVKDGTITIDKKYKLSKIVSTDSTVKNGVEDTKRLSPHINMYVNGDKSPDLGWLFATFSTGEPNKSIYVNFNLISDLNRTSKELPSNQKKYYYLVLSSVR